MFNCLVLFAGYGRLHSAAAKGDSNSINIFVGNSELTYSKSNRDCGLHWWMLDKIKEKDSKGATPVHYVANMNSVLALSRFDRWGDPFNRLLAKLFINF